MDHQKYVGTAKMLRIYIGQDDVWEGMPLYEAIVKKLREWDIAGATVLKGIMGYGARQRIHKTGFLGLSTDMPMMISVVDKREKLDQIIPVLDEMVVDGLLVLSDVEIIKYSHGEPGLEEFSLMPERPRE
jgi:hypothetical protein